MSFVLNAPVTQTLLPALRKQGIKVDIKHLRYSKVSDIRDATPVRPEDMLQLVLMSDENRKKYPPLSHGGKTVVDLLFPDGRQYVGIAQCSRQDRFNRLEGIRIATQRALDLRRHEKMMRESVVWLD